jgi:hypothetical protein
MSKELALWELDDEQIELLPARETLSFHNNWANVWASNTSVAFNAASLYSHAYSSAYQNIAVNQNS